LTRDQKSGSMANPKPLEQPRNWMEPTCFSGPPIFWILLGKCQISRNLPPLGNCIIFQRLPEDDGAKVLGDVTITEINRKGNPMRINCRNDVGDTGYNIPYNVEDTKITFNDFGKSKCIIAIETGGMFDRLVENGFDETHEAILVHIKGQPARSTRRFLQFSGLWGYQNSTYFTHLSNSKC